ncbi:hypothetical protein BKA93DRAFT_754475 [Sparassis latifolia]
MLGGCIGRGEEEGSVAVGVVGLFTLAANPTPKLVLVQQTVWAQWEEESRERETAQEDEIDVAAAGENHSLLWGRKTTGNCLEWKQASVKDGEKDWTRKSIAWRSWTWRLLHVRASTVISGHPRKKAGSSGRWVRRDDDGRKSSVRLPPHREQRGRLWSYRLRSLFV